jgi:membrane protease YdiL (CAAX protease family)
MPDATTPTRRRTRRQIAAFLLLAFALSWWAWPLTLLNPTSTALVPIGPTIAAIVVTAVAEGRGGIADLLRQLVRWRVHPVWYAVALLGPVALVGGAVLVNRGLGAPVDPSVALPEWSALPALLVVRIVVGGPLGEELGWRGFLLPRVLERHGPLAASLLIAPVWFAFHLPAMLSGPVTDQRPPLLFLLWTAALSVLHTWLWLRTGRSVLLVMLFHGAINTAASVLLPLFTGPDYIRAWWVLLALTTAWTVAVGRLDPLFRRR